MAADPEHGSGVSPSSGRRLAVLAEVVRGRREELGLRQSELADLAGCSPRFVHTMEHGKASLRLDKVLDVLEVLGLDLLVAPDQGLRHGPSAGPGLRARP